MPKIADYKYPDLEVEEAIEIAEILVNEFGGDVTSEEQWAQEIGHSTTNSGSYISKMADLRRYGLLTSRGIKATDLAKKAANPRNEKEEQEVRFEMYENVPLLSKLYNHLDGKIPSGEFWRILNEITEANPKEAQESASEIRGLYEDMIESEPEEIAQSGEDRSLTQPDQPSTEVPTTQSTEVYVRVGNDELKFEDRSPTNLEIAISFLKSKQTELDTTQATLTDE